MNTARNLPWNIFDQLQHEIHRSQLPKQFTKTADSNDWAPAVDIKEEDTQFVLSADIPGVNPENIDIQMDGKILTIKGERNSVDKIEQEHYSRIERKQGKFYRRFTLPEGVDSENISAKSNHGVLTLTIKKQEEKKPKKITVN